ncbi:MAG: propionyl-CoA carboxylase [Chloroflexi bacterium]|nr:propionyl-CoA carboxylase [Chloroflexota bacterium]MYD15745.1 propionyl-CoA carboxylase [Chloroflexota bacterium]MYJ01867.1 propionyl-CoA carboxylase [Chloroflexota bacterium]
MIWEPEVEELQRRIALSNRGGTPDRIERQHRLGRLTVRERIHELLDDGSFHEVGALAGLGEYEDGDLVDFSPASYVMGIGKIDGRAVAVGGEDFTIQGGSALYPMQRSKGGLGGFCEELALEYRIPLILLIDGAGANVGATKKMGTTYLPNGSGTGRSFVTSIEAMQSVPVLGAVLGAIAGGPSGRAMMVHWSVMTKGRSAMFAAGPPVVKRGIGHDVTNESLGGSQVHVHTSGCIDNEAEDEQDAFRQIRAMLSYLPDNVNELPPAAPSADPPEGAGEALINLVPRNTRRPYSMQKLICSVVDGGDFFEVKPHWGTAVITGFARVDGMPIGIVANNPRKNGGALDRDGSDKQTHFLELCNYFHIPIVYLVDVPGFMIGEQAEREGTLRAGMRAMWVGLQATVPQLTIVIRKCYGMAGMATGNPTRLNYRLGWPSGEWGSIPIEGGVDAAYRREIAEAEDPEAKREAIEAELRQLRSVFRTAETFGIEEVIDPRETRRYLQEFVERAYKVLPYELERTPLYGVRP